MNREIKFRAWDDINKCWLHGYDTMKEGCNILGEIIIMGGWMQGVKLTELKNIIVEQYTGLKDKNGKEIYEGDVVQYGNDMWDVTFKKGCFFAHEDYLFKWNNNVYLIGNIHEGDNVK